MSSIIAQGELIVTKAATMPVDFTTANVGGTLTTVQITGGVLGSIFFSMPSNGAGGGSIKQTAKVFGYNSNASSAAAYSSLFWIRNSLDLMSTNGQLTITPTGTGEDATRKVRILGYDNSGVATMEEIQLNGLTPVTSATFWSLVFRVELRLFTGSSLVPATADINIASTAGPTSLGIIPATKQNATAEIDIGVESSQNGNGTIALASADPGGVTYFRPRTRATGISAIGGTVLALQGQGIWIRLIIQERALASSSVQLTLVYTASQG